MYHEYFKFDKSPFKLTPDTRFFCQLKPYKDAFDTLMISLQEGEGFIKVTGPIGSGKTILCRQLISHLDDQYATAYILNPMLSPAALYKLIFYELKGELPENAGEITVYKLLNHLLLDLKRQGKKTVLIIDEAQTLSDESLEAIRLLTNLETEKSNLLQVVLFGQPELDERLNTAKFLQLKQRIIFSYYLVPLTKLQCMDYIKHRVKKAGYFYPQLFNKAALNAIFKASQGVPRIINILCHKALISSYGKGEKIVTKNSVRAAIKDTFGKPKKKKMLFGFSILHWFSSTVLLLVLLVGLMSEILYLSPRFL